MRNLIIAAFISVILISCHSKTTSSDKSAITKTNDLQTIFKPILHGHWVEPSYIFDISKTKSPYESQNALADIVELDIDTNDIKNDTLEIGAPSVHEATSCRVYFFSGQTPTTLPTDLIDYQTKTNFTELGYEINGMDTTLGLYYYNKDKKLLKTQKYVKVPKSAASAMQYMVNKTLFAGMYQTTDSTGKAITVTFTNDGMVTGFYNYKGYYIATDFVAGPENNLDEIIFDLYKENQTSYAYVIKADTINFYETTESKDQITLLLGQLKYHLVKQ